MTATYDGTATDGRNAVVAYAEFNTDVSITGTNEAGATPIVTAPTFTPNGRDSFFLEFCAPSVTPAVSGGVITIVVYDNGNPIFAGTSGIAVVTNSAAGVCTYPCLTRLRITQPTAVAHSYSVRAFRGVGNGTVNGTNGGTSRPGYVMIERDF